MNIADILTMWQNIGVFDYLLPFLLIFAVIFGILGATKILSGNKGVNVTIAVVIGLLALRLPYARDFFTQVFPRLGVGVAILVSLLILTGLFIRPENLKVMIWIFIAIGSVIGLVIVFGSFSALGFGGGVDWFQNEAVVWIISIALLIGLIVVVVVGQLPPDTKGYTMERVPHGKSE